MEEKETMKNEEGLVVSDFSEMRVNSPTQRKVYTTLTDKKKLFNLESTCDNKINDCKGELINVVDIVIKVNEKKLKEPVIDEDTGEVIKDIERSVVTILIDNNGTSYVTGSKMFGMQMMNYIMIFGIESIKNGVTIRIIEKAVKNSNNKALGFELV